MSDDAAAVAAFIREIETDCGRIDVLVNNAGHPVRRADRGVPGREVEPDRRDQLERAFHSIRAAIPGMKPAAPAGSSSYLASAHRAGRLALQECLRLRQARHRRPHQDGRARSRRARRHRQRHLPRLRQDAAGREADPRTGGRPRHHARAGGQGRAARRSAHQALRHRRGGRRTRALPVGRPRGLHHPAIIPIDGGWTAH